MTTKTTPIAMYGLTTTDKSEAFSASNSAFGKIARSAVERGFILAWMKFIATHMPSSEPIGLNA